MILVLRLRGEERQLILESASLLLAVADMDGRSWAIVRIYLMKYLFVSAAALWGQCRGACAAACCLLPPGKSFSMTLRYQ